MRRLHETSGHAPFSILARGLKARGVSPATVKFIKGLKRSACRAVHDECCRAVRWRCAYRLWQCMWLQLTVLSLAMLA